MSQIWQRFVPVGRRNRILCLTVMAVTIGSAQAAEAAESRSLAETNELLDLIWLMFAAALVFFMQAGFLCLEAGLCRAKNSINVAVKNGLDFVVATACYWGIGFGLMFGSSCYGWFGTDYFFADFGPDNTDAAFFLFQLMFASTAATIVSGSIAERTRLSSYLVLTAVVTAIIYPVFAHWAWGGVFATGDGWLKNLGFVDFAGSTCVHAVGGVVAIVAAWYVGPRKERKFVAGKKTRIQPSSLVMSFLGVLLLAIGWLGFNCGSQIPLDVSVARIGLNTILAAAFGGLAIVASQIYMKRKILPEIVGNGILGGLVSITAGCHVVTPHDAMVIGLIGAAIVYWGTELCELIERIDDVVGAIPVHAFCGLWGTLAVALFIPADELVLLGFGRLEFLGIQAIGCISVLLWVIPTAAVSLWLIEQTIGLRVDSEAEELGLNIAEHDVQSTLYDLSQSFKKIVDTRRFDREQRVTGEVGTEVGGLAECFNQLIEAACLDQDENQQLLHDIKASQQRLQCVLESSMDCIIQIRGDGQILDFNATAEKVFGVERQEIIHKFFHEQFLTDEMVELFQEELELAEQGNATELFGTPHEVMLKRIGGEVFPAEIFVNEALLTDSRIYIVFARDITKQKQAEQARADAQIELVTTARQAGIAEVATGVLHNVGNVLNSVNVSANSLAEMLEASRISRVGDVARLLANYQSQLEIAFPNDERIKRVPGYLDKLHQQILEEQTRTTKEVSALLENIQHVKQVIAMQQSMAKTTGLIEPCCVHELVDSALAMMTESFTRHQIIIDRDYQELPNLLIDRQKVMQILVNLIKNAKEAMGENSEDRPKQIALVIEQAEHGTLRISVSDSGNGISPVNLQKMFKHGFTTKKTGHGFGLHSCANFAREMGGKLTVASPGEGQGATFILELPYKPVTERALAVAV